MLVLVIAVSICGVIIALLHIGLLELAAKFETGIEISPLLDPILGNLQNFTEQNVSQ